MYPLFTPLGSCQVTQYKECKSALRFLSPQFPFLQHGAILGTVLEEGKEDGGGTGECGLTESTVTIPGDCSELTQTIEIKLCYLKSGVRTHCFS